MSELLMKGLVSTKRELEAGVADAEAELVRARARCRELRAVVALARAQADAAPKPPAPRLLEQPRTRAPAYSLATPAAAAPPPKVSIPRRWVPTLAAFRRLD